jgi:hypothetical protein
MMPTKQDQALAPAEVALRVILWCALYGMVAFRAVYPNVDADLWWHLRVGQWVVEHREVTTTDSFSQWGLASEKPWLAYSWLFEVLIYGLYSQFGLVGVVAYRLLMSLAVVATLHWFQAGRKPAFLPGAFPLVLTVFAFCPLITERPWLFTILFFIITLNAVLTLRAGTASWTIWLLPLIYALWANIHIQFVYGLFLLGLACIGPVIDRVLWPDRADDTAATFRSRTWWQLVLLTSLCTASTLANPYHARLYGVVLEYATQQAPFRFIDELTALSFRFAWDWAVLGLTLAAAFTLGRKTRLSSFDALLLMSTAWFSFRAKRDVWFVTVAAVAILAEAFPAPASVRTPRWTRWIVVGFVLSIVGVTYPFFWNAERMKVEVAQRYPAAAVAFIKQRGYAGQLYNGFNWGGYLIWELPNLPVSIDGRTNLYGDERITRAFLTEMGTLPDQSSNYPGWDADPDVTGAELLICDRHTPLAALLERDTHFEVVYRDELAVVLVTKAR